MQHISRFTLVTHYNCIDFLSSFIYILKRAASKVGTNLKIWTFFNEQNKNNFVSIQTVKLPFVPVYIFLYSFHSLFIYVTKSRKQIVYSRLYYS